MVKSNGKRSAPDASIRQPRAVPKQAPLATDRPRKQRRVAPFPSPLNEARPMDPEVIQDENQLIDVLTRPRLELIEFIRSVTSPLVILGAGGKMGPTLAVLAQRAAQLARHPLQVIAVSRFADASSRRWLERYSVKTLSADLLKRNEVRKLPKAAQVIYLAGLKFGTQENPALTWAVNTIAPAYVAEHYASSRIVALSTGNVYPLVPFDTGGAAESQALTPLGEYSNAAIARERVFEYFAQNSSLSLALIRLNYAVELRYGVLLDIAQKVAAGELIDLTTGYFNCLWQGDANEMIIRSLALTTRPPAVFNLTGPTVFSVRAVAKEFARHLGRPARFVGTEAPSALLNNPAKICRQLGPPSTSPETMIRWIAHWIKRGGQTLNKPTHFEVRDGQY